MATLTIRLPDDKHERLRLLAKHRRISMNKLINVALLAALARLAIIRRTVHRGACPVRRRNPLSGAGRARVGQKKRYNCWISSIRHHKRLEIP